MTNYMNPMMSPYGQQNGQNPPMPPQAPSDLDRMMAAFGQSNGKPSFIPGRVVQSIDEVYPKEIPMDGSFYYFPLKDYSAIYVKVWTPNVDLLTFKFVPEDSVKIPQPGTVAIPDDFKSDIFSRLERIESLLTPKSKKEVKADG